ncbi:MAG: hypothetical protein U0165_15185 [Polyangiaceae bacterium]
MRHELDREEAQRRRTAQYKSVVGAVVGWGSGVVADTAGVGTAEEPGVMAERPGLTLRIGVVGVSLTF